MVNWAFKPESKDRSVLEKSVLSFSYFSGKSQTKILSAHRQVRMWSVLIDTTKIHRLLPTSLTQELCVHIAHSTHSNETNSRLWDIRSDIGIHV